MKSTTDRDSNFELLRIVAMMMIVGFPSVYKGNIIDASFMNKILIDIVWHWGEIGVNVFLLISGYHLAYQEYNRRKIYYIVLQVLFYLVFTTIVACLYWNVPITSYIKANCFPVLSARYWFITVYIYIYTVSLYKDGY